MILRNVRGDRLSDRRTPSDTVAPSLASCEDRCLNGVDEGAAALGSLNEAGRVEQGLGDPNSAPIIPIQVPRPGLRRTICSCRCCETMRPRSIALAYVGIVPRCSKTNKHENGCFASSELTRKALIRLCASSWHRTTPLPVTGKEKGEKQKGIFACGTL